MDAETLLSAEDALEKGFADRIEEPIRIAAAHNLEAAKAVAAVELRHKAALSAKDNEISRLQGEIKDIKQFMPTPADANACIQAAASLGLPATMATDWLQAGISQATLNERLAFAGVIKDACIASSEDPAPYLDKINDYTALFHDMLVNIKAAKDQHIDNTLSPDAISGETGSSDDLTAKAESIFQRRASGGQK